jgi:hypothetical protein
VPHLSTDTAAASHGMRESVGLGCAPVTRPDKREGMISLLSSTGTANIQELVFFNHLQDILFELHKER